MIKNVRPILISEKAVSAMKQFLKEESTGSDILYRVLVINGGCTGYMINIRFEEEKNINYLYDTVYDYDGVKIVIDVKSSRLLAGATLDYSDGLQGKGFIWEYKNAVASCGCGKSFAV